MFKKISIGLFLITAGVLTAGIISYAWTEPGSNPPEGNLGGLAGVLQNGVIHAKDFVVDYTNSAGQTATKSLTLYIDKDGDGYTPAQGDFNDNDASVHPGAAPQYNSGKDADCNGVTEYTVDMIQNVNTWNVDSACTKGGHAVNMIAYITDAAGWAKLNNHTVTYDINGNINNINLIRGFDWGNKFTKRLICLSNEPTRTYTSPCRNYISNQPSICPDGKSSYVHSYSEHIYVGNSGNSGSCGGHGEMDYDYYNNTYDDYYDNSSTSQPADPAKTQYGFWHIWCN